ncbi:MAG TPA: rRNA pseudouridine synthase [Nitrosospira sp.]|jgi:23S rRNA pseudouridine2604 synthase|nr:rRNA pseudouridine synthase [Nitrosospira sp.]
MTESVRLAKRVAELAPCSRSEAEQYILGGWVTVDGQVVEEPGFRVLQQKVELAPGASLAEVVPVTLLLHKPAGYDAVANPPVQLVTPDNLAADDRGPAVSFLKRHLTGLTLTDPLDTGASGLLVLTQDWRVARKLVDEAAKIEHEFIVEVAGEPMADGLALLNQGVTWNGKPLPPMKVSWQNETRLRFALKSPPRGLIAHVCEKLGLKVVSMKRIRIGRVPMAGLQPGQWRYLRGYERF